MKIVNTRMLKCNTAKYLQGAWYRKYIITNCVNIFSWFNVNIDLE